MAGAVLHWDYENAPVPRGVSVLYVLREMRQAIHERFGPLLGAYVYADPQNLTSARRHEISASGLDIIDCSRESGKLNAVDFRIISRSLAELARPVALGSKRSAVVVVTGDGDYAYALSTLRNVGVDTMLIFDDDRHEAVASSMLQVADHTVPISFGGRELDDDNDDGASTVEFQELPGPTVAATGLGTALDPLQHAFMQAVTRAPAADDDGFRWGPAIGDLFHRLRNAQEPKGKERQTVYRATLKRLLEADRIERRYDSGNVLLRLKVVAP